MFCMCKDCLKVVGCSLDEGKTIRYCTQCLFVEQCNHKIELGKQAKAKLYVLFIDYPNHCYGHSNLKGGHYEES